MKLKLLNIYTVAGFPHLNDTLSVMKAIEDAGADMIELGMPYSDPVADGPVIESAAKKALQNGMSIPVLFSQLQTMRNTIHVPVYLMGYLNPVIQFGMERFCENAHAVGIAGVIIPDLPAQVFKKEYTALFKKHHLNFVCLVTPETSDKRIKQLDKISSGFLYAVSSSSTTGKNKDVTDQEAYFKKLHSLNLKNKVLIGFGIKDKSTFEFVTQYADGAIVGSAFVQAIENAAPSEFDSKAKSFVETLR